LRDTAPPIFVVGQPRSGSTLLTRILNEAPELFVINDFYVLQKIDAAGLWNVLSQDQARSVAGWVYERIHIRATEEREKTLSQSIEMTDEQLAALNEMVHGPWAEGLLWHEVLGAVMAAAARLGGHKRWGYNTPQDHLHLDRLFSAFPGSKAVFLLRDPVGLLKSYKNVSGPWHDARRYNPTAIGLAWRAAARAFLRLRETHPGQVMLISYEDLTHHTATTLAALSEFLGTTVPPVDLAGLGRNSSHDGARRLDVSENEIWLASRPILKELETLGFETPNASFRLGGAPALAGIYASGAAFHLKALLADPDRRKRILRLLQSSATGREPKARARRDA
jgi:hypothetical protein